MKEIGGYIELDTYRGTMVHEDGIKLNCGRNALAYLIKARNVKSILMPKFMCDSCDKVLKENDVVVEYYQIGYDFKPQILKRDKWLYVVNFYGQLSNEYLSSLGKKVIVDNAQAYFQEPIKGIDTIYTCRKFFGVADGAILYTDQKLEISEQDESYDRMKFLLGRYERSASEFYSDYVENNQLFKTEKLKKMSKLTENLLHGIDYEYIKKVRTRNFAFLHGKFQKVNRLFLTCPEGAFMYPLYIQGGKEIRKKLQEQKIFVPTLWPATLKLCDTHDLEFDMAENILPLPVDQRYELEDMNYIFEKIQELL